MSLADLVRAFRQPRHPWMLSVAPHEDWRTLDAPAPVAPELLVTPHTPAPPIRCYDARIHKGGLRVTLGVFDNPSGEESFLFVATRLMLDAEEIPSASTQMVRLGRLQALARTGWIQVTRDDSTEKSPAGGWGDAISNINWCIPEPKTRRVHFASTFIDPEQGQAASNLVHELLRSARFVSDDGRRVDSAALVDHA